MVWTLVKMHLTESLNAIWNYTTRRITNRRVVFQYCHRTEERIQSKWVTLSSCALQYKYFIIIVTFYNKLLHIYIASLICTMVIYYFHYFLTNLWTLEKTNCVRVLVCFHIEVRAEYSLKSDLYSNFRLILLETDDYAIIEVDTSSLLNC